MVYLVFGKLLFCFGIFLILLDKFAGLYIPNIEKIISSTGHSERRDRVDQCDQILQNCSTTLASFCESLAIFEGLPIHYLTSFKPTLAIVI